MVAVATLITGGGGNDIIDGDAWLHVGLTSYTAGASIIRQINYDPNGNTYDPLTGLGHINAANVDIAIFNDVMANYNVALFGPDAEGFLTIQHVAAVGGGGLGGGNVIDDGTDRIRNIERLQFADGTVAIDRWQHDQRSFVHIDPSDQFYASSTLLTMMRFRSARPRSPRRPGRQRGGSGAPWRSGTR